MKPIIFYIAFLAFNNLIHGQIQSTKANISKAQFELVYKKTKTYPENTQLSIALIKNENVEFLGIKRVNDSIIQTQNRDKIFEIGSISKVFTSTLLSHFVVNEQLELNTPVENILDFDVATNQAITLKQLANHTSGLPRLPSNLNLFLADPNNPYKNYNEQDLQVYLKEKIGLKQPPGEKYEYSNLGAGLLAYLLGNLSNTSYEDMLQDIIFSKYNMPSSTTDITKLKHELVNGLNASGEKTSNWDLNILAGAGAILSSAEDLSQFALAHFDDDTSTLQLSHQPTFTVNDKMKIGLGWHILKVDDSKNELIWHNGGTGGYTSSMALDLKAKNAVIILSNVSAFHKDNRKIDELCFELLKSLATSKNKQQE